MAAGWSHTCPPPTHTSHPRTGTSPSRRSAWPRCTPGWSSSSDLRVEPDRAGDAGAAQAAVAVGHLREVLLVVVLGVVELAELGDLGRDRAVAGRGQALAEDRLGGFHGRALLGRGRVDGRAVLAARVIALAHALRRV